MAGPDVEEAVEDAPLDLAELFVLPLVEELHAETDAVVALRKALLGFIMIVDANSSGALGAFIHYLLAGFEPLIDHFDEDGRHSFIRGEDVMLVAEGGTPTLAIRKELAQSLRREWIEFRFRSILNEDYASEWEPKLQGWVDEAVKAMGQP